MTVTTQQERKQIIVPGEVYYVTYEWILEETTLVPVGVRVIETHA